MYFKDYITSFILLVNMFNTVYILYMYSFNKLRWTIWIFVCNIQLMYTIFYFKDLQTHIILNYYTLFVIIYEYINM